MAYNIQVYYNIGIIRLECICSRRPMCPTCTRQADAARLCCSVLHMLSAHSFPLNSSQIHSSVSMGVHRRHGLLQALPCITAFRFTKEMPGTGQFAKFSNIGFYL